MKGVDEIIMPDVAMRDAFINKLYQIAAQDRRVILLSDDFGAPSLDRFRRDLGKQYFNMGIAEQNMASVAAGLALSGKIVFMYAIASFITQRCYEQMRLDLCNMNLPVTAVGVGVGFGYGTAGPTHHTIEDISLMSTLPGMTILSPCDNVAAEAFAEITYREPGTKYVRLDREKLPSIYGPDQDFSEGLAHLKTGRELTIIATGIMVHRSFTVAAELAKHSIDAGIIDLYRIKPINEKLLLSCLKQSKKVLTLEENLVSGGVGSLVARILAENGQTPAFKCMAIPDKHYFKYGGRNYLHSCCGLDTASITNVILEWL